MTLKHSCAPQGQGLPASSPDTSSVKCALRAASFGSSAARGFGGSPRLKPWRARLQARPPLFAEGRNTVNTPRCTKAAGDGPDGLRAS
jgi:hypothetical protein